MEIFLIILLSIAALYFLFTFILFITAFRRFPGNRTPSATKNKSDGSMPDSFRLAIEEGADWYKAQETEEIFIDSFDGLKLRATYLPAEGEQRGLFIGIHGYRSSPLHDMGASAKYYHDLGFSLLLPSQRACGGSEGKYITFGARERSDVKSWCDYAYERFGDGTPIVLAGISLGSSSVLMSLEFPMPETLCAVIADCGFSSVYDELESVMESQTHFTPKAVIWGVNLWCRLFAGFDVSTVTTEKALSINKIPILFIHGESDRFVPTKFSQVNYELCTAEKEIFTVPGAGHGLSYLVDMDGYHKRVEAFLDKNCPGGNQ